jgi:hypothetical protein
MQQYAHLAGRSYALVTFAIPVRHPPCQETKIHQLNQLLTFLISSKVFHQSENFHLERGGKGGTLHHPKIMVHPDYLLSFKLTL